MNYRDLVQAQYELNDKLAGSDWLTNSFVDYKFAVADEVMELNRSMGWKPWWVKGERTVDNSNAQLEVIDILHFHISGMIKDMYNEPMYEGEDKEFLISNVARIIENLPTIEQLETEDLLKDFPNDDTLPLHYLAEVIDGGFVVATQMFLVLANYVGLSKEELFSFYLAKHTLNRFRNDHNYKGDKECMPAYQKIWSDGNEDNYYVMKYVRGLIKDGIKVSADSLYSSIEKQYAFFTGKSETV